MTTTTAPSVLIFRLENDNHDGPYTTGHYNAGSRNGQHPGPTADGIDGLSFTHKHIFGFKDEVQLRNWFDEACMGAIVARNHTAMTGPQHLAVYKVPNTDVLYGKHQVAFLRDGAELLYTVPLNSSSPRYV